METFGRTTIVAAVISTATATITSWSAGTPIASTAITTAFAITTAAEAAIVITGRLFSTCLREVFNEIKMSFAFHEGCWNGFGFRCFHCNDHALDGVTAGAGHVDHVFVKSSFRLIELQLLVDHGLRFFFSLSFREEGCFFSDRFFKNETGKFCKGFHDW